MKNVIAMYLRISKEDFDNAESESIQNQRKIIYDYINKNFKDSEIIEFVDDGYSGTNFNRPAFKKMYEMVLDKKINVIIVKSLSRFGRNYIETGRFVEKIFPNNLVRFIALLDSFDNFRETSINDFAPIKGVFNELYCKNTSEAIKKSKKQNMKEGYYACSIAPYGYKKENGKLVINNQNAKIVKYIFELKESGKTQREIAQILNEKNITTPSKSGIWKKSYICRILSNRVYLGETIRKKTSKISYKSKKRIYYNREKYIVIKNTHEPIINYETFEKVHANNKYGRKIKQKSIEYPLKNKIYCDICKRKMIINKVRDDYYLYCENNIESEKICPNSIKINYERIEKVVIDNILKQKMNKERINQICEKEMYNKKQEFVKKLEAKKESINNKIKKLYSKKLEDNDTIYDEYSSLVLKRRKIEEKIKNINKMKFENIITKEDITLFVDKIYVKSNKIIIMYNFT